MMVTMVMMMVMMMMMMTMVSFLAGTTNQHSPGCNKIVPPNHTRPNIAQHPPGAIYVVDELDYERRQSYELLIRATDSVSGVSAEVPVSVLVQDVNDCPPEIEQDSYNITVSERAPFGTAILKVQAKDNDTGKLNHARCPR
uniref:Cadherin domain-containing protein n=1 Tax=Anopheles maculatus TaxID=74869 RepID=A0A182SLW1_9DIPT